MDASVPRVGTCMEVWKMSSPGVVGAGLGSGTEAGSMNVFVNKVAEELLFGALGAFRGLRASIVVALSMLCETEKKLLRERTGNTSRTTEGELIIYVFNGCIWHCSG